jgi:hypothetical protein
MKKLFGYVLPLTLMIIFLSVGLLTTVLRKAFVFQDKINFAVKREKARTLALAGIQVGMSQVSFIKPKEKQEKNKKEQNNKNNPKEDTLTPEQEWLLQLISVINRWQVFNLTRESDGIDARMQIYISCEQGKINLNALLLRPLEAEKNKPDNSKQEVTTKRKNFAESLEEKLVQEVGLSILEILKIKQKKLGRSLEDPTELLTEEAARKFETRIFNTPQEKKAEKAERFVLMDLFTTQTRTEKLNPWLLSASVCALLGFDLPQKLLAQGKDKIIRDAVKKLRPFIGWKKDWDQTLQPLYGKNFTSIPTGIDVIFAPEFEATIFSVICYVEVAGITQGVCGVIEKTADGNNTVFRLKKLYWI